MPQPTPVCFIDEREMPAKIFQMASHTKNHASFTSHQKEQKGEVNTKAQS